METPIADLDARIERVLAALASAARGDLEVRIEAEEREDRFVEIEVAVNFLLEELSLARRENESQHQEIIDKNLALVARDRALIMALSTPIMTVWPGVLTLPIIGPIDAERRATITDTLLHRISAERVTHVVLDVTGMTDPDAPTVEGLMSTARAAKLLGVECILAGVTPEVAEEMVALRSELRIPTVAKVSDAVRRILRG
jgi:rsbT co-antagonist protein RsbR